MSDEETFESADAGAAHCIPFKAGDLRKGSFVAIKGHPCKVRAGRGQRGARLPSQRRRCGASATHDPRPALPQVEEVTTSKTGKHGHAKANYYGYDIFTGKRYEDVAPTSHNVSQPIVERIEYILTDINDDDSNEEGSIVTLMTEGGEQREDLRLPDEDAYKGLRDQFLEGSKEILVTVVSAMGINRIGAFGTGGGANGSIFRTSHPRLLPSLDAAQTHSTFARSPAPSPCKHHRDFS